MKFERPKVAWLLLRLSLALTVAGCAGTSILYDFDNDGSLDGDDCAPSDPTIHPSAEDELGDGIDQNCDGVDGNIVDADGDGYAGALDCDDSDPSVHPGADDEPGDGIDQDCDGVDGVAGDDDDSAQCTDLDGDSWCVEEGDCDDGNAQVNPAAAEICDAVDNDCNGLVDEDAVDLGTWYLDADEDGYGASHLSVQECSAPASYVDNNNDCDDLDPEAYPGATEVCDQVDNNCDGDVDEGLAAPSTWYGDADGDGFGDLAVSVVACTAPPGYVADSSDCQDLDPNSNPAALEVCDEVDNNCDGVVDEGDAAPSTWYADADGDSFGNGLISIASCTAPFGTVAISGDCDDLDATSYPGGSEICDSADNNCDGQVDEGVTTTFFVDSDSDGYGDPGSPVPACSLPGGASTNALDCDDNQPALNPGGVEICDGIDNNCDGIVDNGAVDADTWYVDADADGYGDPATEVTNCSPAAGSVTNGDDCDDVDGTNFPGNTETCNGADEDCDSVIDNGFDNDGDGITTCGPDGVNGNADDDCNDTVAGASPGGQSAACPAASCAAAQAILGSPVSGTYWLEPGGSGAFEAYCDMTTDGGGWTLVAVNGNNLTLTMATGAMGQVAQIVPSDPGADVIHKLSDATINQIKADNGDAVGIRLIFEGTLSLKKFGKAGCTWESDSRDPAEPDCDYATGTYSTNPAWTGPATSYWFSGGLPSWALGGCPSWERMGIYSTAYNNTPRSFFHVGACGVNSWGTLWVR